MFPEMMSPPYEGPCCVYCGKPLHPSKNIIRRANAIREQESNSTAHLMSRVFLLRCRSCVRETVYTIDQFVRCAEGATNQDLSSN
jgi:hypothetical protein